MNWARASQLPVTAESQTTTARTLGVRWENLDMPMGERERRGTLEEQQQRARVPSYLGDQARTVFLEEWELPRGSIGRRPHEGAKAPRLISNDPIEKLRVNLRCIITCAWNPNKGWFL